MEQVLEQYEGLTVSIDTVNDEHYGILHYIKGNCYCQLNGVDEDTGDLYKVTIFIDKIVSITTWYNTDSNNDVIQEKAFVDVL